MQPADYVDALRVLAVHARSVAGDAATITVSHIDRVDLHILKLVPTRPERARSRSLRPSG